MAQDIGPQAASTTTRTLPAIPLLHVGTRFPIETALAIGDRGYDLLDRATVGIPTAAIRVGDFLSRRWLARVRHPYLAEIDEIARLVMRPGTHYFNVHYEWGCTSAAKPVPEGQGEGFRLVRVLDWRTPGLGRHVVAARVAGAAGPWVTLTWPGYTGVLQAMAKGRFAAGLNQAPARIVRDSERLDWWIAKARVWRSRALTPGHLLRQVFEQAASYTEAKERLTTTPVTSPVIYTLAGPGAGEGCVIEREEEAAKVLEASASGIQCTNDWQQIDAIGRRRPGRWSAERLAAMRAIVQAPDFARPFAWLQPPMLNDESRVAIVADPATGRFAAQGYEADGPATAVLDHTI
jgi:hypothetical protein